MKAKHLVSRSAALPGIAATSLLACALLTGCSSGDSSINNSIGGPVLLRFVDDRINASDVSAMLFVGNVYLDAQLAPVTYSGVQLQASEAYVKDQNIYVAYSSFDTNGVVSKVGAVQHVKPVACDSLLTTLLDYCLAPTATVGFPTTDIFATYSDGSNLYAVGSTTDITSDPYYGRLFKLPLDSGQSPSTVSLSTTLNSFAGNGVTGNGTNLLVTYGTHATDPTLKGGLGAFNLSTLASINSQSIFDARSVAIDPSNTANAFVIRGYTTSSNASAVMKFPTTAATTPAPSATTLMSIGGNTTPESHSTVVVGNQLILASTGVNGFKILCKATGAEVLSVPAPLYSGIAASKTVTNSVAAIPGYLFTANGEGGVTAYTFKKSASNFTSNYCNGVAVSFVGRLALDSDNSDATYVNAELSANSLKPLTILNAFNVVTSRLLVVSSGNKGISLLDISGLSLSLNDVDDFP